MSIAAPELVPAVVEGVPSDATLGIAPDLAEPIAGESEGLPSPEDVLLPPDGTDGEELADDSPDVEVQAQIEQARQAVIADYETKIANLQRVKDTEVRNKHDELLSRMTWEQEFVKHMLGQFQQLGIDPDQVNQQMELAIGRADRAAAQALRFQQTQVATVQDVYQYQVSRFQEHQQAAQQAGKPVINPTDPEFLARWNPYMAEVGKYGVAQARARAAVAAGSPVAAADAQADYYLTALGNELRDWQENHYRPSLSARQEAEQKRQIAKTQKAAATKQAQRGSQHIAGNGSGAAAMDLPQHIAAVKADPKFAKATYDQQHTEAYRRYFATRGGATRT